MDLVLRPTLADLMLLADDEVFLVLVPGPRFANANALAFIYSLRYEREQYTLMILISMNSLKQLQLRVRYEFFLIRR